MSKGLEMCDKCDYFISVEEAYQQGRADAIAEFEPLLKLLVDMESEYICDEMCGTEWCGENCKYNCPQKECYLKYSEQLKEQNNE